jgi:rfaE bifunctional protein kinase chain/domain
MGQMTGELERLGKSRVLVVGDVMLDRYWHGSVDRVSPEAPVPIVRMTTEECRLGGAGNVARNVASLGAAAALMGIVGEDEAAEQVRRLLEAGKIDDCLLQDNDAPTTVKLRISGRAQQLLRIDFERRPTSNVVERMQQRFRRDCSQFQAVILSDYGKGGLSLIQSKLSHARSIGLPVLIDPKGSDWSGYRGATVVTPNRSELVDVIGTWGNEGELEDRVHQLRADLDIGAILLTRSEEGMSLFDDQGRLDVSAVAREVFDVTGAGDTVIGTLGAMIGANFSLREALPYANRAAGIVVGKFGAAAIEPEELFQ